MLNSLFCVSKLSSGTFHGMWTGDMFYLNKNILCQRFLFPCWIPLLLIYSLDLDKPIQTNYEDRVRRSAEYIFPHYTICLFSGSFSTNSASGNGFLIIPSDEFHSCNFPVPNKRYTKEPTKYVAANIQNTIWNRS